MKYLFIFNDSPYGSQRAYNGLRLALALARKAVPVRVFLLGDGVTCALVGPAPGNPEYYPQEMLQAIADAKNEIIACGTCMDARGLTQSSLIPAVRQGTLDQLVEWTEGAEKVLSF
jgi:uncharacterized protein involved in oxidation of intracellular sulfur